MLDYIIMALLLLNGIGVFLLLLKGTNKQKGNVQIDLQKKFAEQQMIWNREWNELKTMMERHHEEVLTELGKWEATRQSMQQTSHSTQNQHLFLQDRYKEIFHLHQQGFSVEQIAKKLDKGVGEVSFILQLAGPPSK
ncbi:helix-turn-helix domain-containing protein [Neobacillus thermocopriae]|uniref:helix-turn-helix domain-containing protein n=1 Tax=Neobacillus thermocopriae TaxID=1215031 RepID=UPI00376F90A1